MIPLSDIGMVRRVDPEGRPAYCADVSGASLSPKLKSPDVMPDIPFPLPIAL